MSMLAYHREVLQDRKGNILQQATVTVTNIAGDPATLYSDREGSEAVDTNVLDADAHGQVEFYAAPGYYTLSVHMTGYVDYQVGVMLAPTPQFSLDFYETLSDACADAAANDAPLRWSGELKTVTGNIAGFWGCQHMGRGRITRGTDTFYIHPRRSQTNRIYIDAATGDDENDGLTASFPFATLQAAVTAVADFAEVLPGRWEFILAAGTQTGTVVVPSQLRSVYPITIKGASVGGHPNVPTTKLAAQAAGNTILSLSEGRAWFFLQDIEFTGATVGTALNLIGGVRVTATNCHVDGTCLNGVINQHGSLFAPLGGIYRGPGKAVAGGLGIYSTYNSTHAFSGTGPSDGVQVIGWESGVLVSEGANGHIDGIQFEDNGTGLEVRRGAGACNGKLCSFKRNDVGVEAFGEFFLNQTVWGTGADANAQDVKRRGNALEFDFTTQDHAVRTSRLIESVYNTAPHTGTLVSTQVYAFTDIRSWMIGEAGDELEIEALIVKTGSAGTCSVWMYLYDGTTEDLVGSVVIPATADDYRLFGHLAFSNAAAQRGQLWINGGPTGSYNIGALDMRHKSGELRLKYQLADAGDSIATPLIRLAGTIGG